MTESDLIIERDQPFADGPRPLLWDVYTPREGANGDVVLVLHGGGWRVGSRAEMTRAASAFAARGYTAIAPEYRLLGETPWPGQIGDVCRAIEAVRTRNLGQRIFLAGYSAGATLALLCAAAPELAAGDDHRHEAIAGVAAFFPFARLGSRFMESLGLDEAGLARFSPETHAATVPPTILFTGAGDKVTPADTALSLCTAIADAGGIVDLRLYARLVHEFVCLPGMMEQTIDDAARFFDRTVRDAAPFNAACDTLDQWWKNTIAGNVTPMPAWD